MLDSRSEKEYNHAHIPGAINLPLLNNEHRNLVGLEYKLHGKSAAVTLGFELAGPLFHSFIKRVKELTPKREIMIYCWRGGMRSSIMTWILSLAGYKVYMLRGGYKVFRKLVLEQFGKQIKIKIIGGNTGSGKTEIIKELKNQHQQVIDLEGMANHKGSAFGHLGEKPQPSTEHFENLLAMQLLSFSENRIVWVEGESRTIGSIKIPDAFFDQLHRADLIELICSYELRKSRILEEYWKFSKKELAICTSKLAKKLGNLKLNEALAALEDERQDDWVEIMLEYYDKNYSYSMLERKSELRIPVVREDHHTTKDIAKRLINLNGIPAAKVIQ